MTQLKTGPQTVPVQRHRLTVDVPIGVYRRFKDLELYLKDKGYDVTLRSMVADAFENYIKATLRRLGLKSIPKVKPKKRLKL